jgi:hypothetical protein
MTEETIRDQVARLLFKELAIARGHGPDQWHELWTSARESVQEQIDHAYRLTDQILALVSAELR